jgi:hypothetical protein
MGVLVSRDGCADNWLAGQVALQVCCATKSAGVRWQFVRCAEHFGVMGLLLQSMMVRILLPGWCRCNDAEMPPRCFMLEAAVMMLSCSDASSCCYLKAGKLAKTQPTSTHVCSRQ